MLDEISIACCNGECHPKYLMIEHANLEFYFFTSGHFVHTLLPHYIHLSQLLFTCNTLFTSNITVQFHTASATKQINTSHFIMAFSQGRNIIQEILGEMST